MMLFARDVLSRVPGGTILFDVKCTQRLAPAIREAGGTPLMYKTGHSLIKAKMKEVGSPLGGEMSGHIFFKERWYGFDDGTYAGARLLEILSREQDPSAVLDALPTSFSTPELNVQCAEGEPHRIVAELLATGAVSPRRREVIHHRRRARRLARRLRPDPRLQHHAGAGAALRGPDAGGAAAHRRRDAGACCAASSPTRRSRRRRTRFRPPRARPRHPRARTSSFPRRREPGAFASTAPQARCAGSRLRGTDAPRRADRTAVRTVPDNPPVNILIVKLSSLGDVVQTLPVLHDLHARFPDARIDWVVEQAFADLVRRAQGVRRVLPVAERRWRKARWAASTRSEIRAHPTALREVAYDAVHRLPGPGEVRLGRAPGPPGAGRLHRHLRQRQRAVRLGVAGAR